MDWIEQHNRLVKTFTASGFSEIIAKLQDLSRFADAHNHHPDFTVFEYRKIQFELWTHSKNAVTAADYSMAEYIDTLFAKGV